LKRCSSPFQLHLRDQKDLELAEAVPQLNDMGFIAMKGLGGGLLNNARSLLRLYAAAIDNVVPIWGIQYASGRAGAVAGAGGAGRIPP
jgi:hypothetical protein